MYGVLNRRRKRKRRKAKYERQDSIDNMEDDDINVVDFDPATDSFQLPAVGKNTAKYTEYDDVNQVEMINKDDKTVR